MKKFLLTLVAMLPLLGFAQTEQLDLMQVIPNDPAVRTGTLESGIKYYIRHNAKDAKRANFHIIYDVGAIQEEDNQNGLAHFLEHMAFNGSKNFKGNALVDYLQSIGVRFGENLNAGTGQEMTTYMVTNVPLVRESITDSVLLVLHDWAGFINLDPKDIDEERGVIREEWRQGMSAGQRIQEQQAPAMFGNSLYAKRNVIGNEEVLKSFTYDDLKSFYHKWYRPDMQAFVIVGDFDVDKMEAKLKTVMADIKPFDVKTPKNKIIVQENQTPLVSVATDPEMTATGITVLFRHKPIAEKYANRIIAEKSEIVTQLISMMINERMSDISKKENAPFLGASASYFKFVEPFDAFYLGVQSKDGQSIPALEAGYTEMLRMQRGGFTASELERAKINFVSQQERAYNNRNDRRNGEFVNKYMSNFTNNTPYMEAEYELNLDKQIVAQTTLEEINATASTLVRDLNSAVLISAPASSQVPDSAAVVAAINKVKASEIKIFTEDVKVAPLVDDSKITAGKVVKESKGEFESTVWTLSNGVTVVVKPTTFKADEVVMSSVQMGGYSTIEDLKKLASLKFFHYFAGNAGLSTFTQSELNKMLTGKIASVGVGFGDLTVGLNGSSTPKDIETMFQLAYLKMTAPRFEQSDLNVVTNQWKSMLPNIVKTPNYIFGKTVTDKVSGGDPRAMVDLPSMELLEMVTLADMEAMYKAQFANANGMKFVFTGNFEMAKLKPLVEKYIASLPSTQVTPAYGKYEVKEVKGIIKDEFKTKMETPKVTALIAYTGSLDWNSDERINLAAINHILQIRYTKSIREEAGGTYGVGVQMAVKQNPRPEFGIVMNFNTDTTKIAQLLPIIYKEIDDMIANGVSDENLKIYKEFAVKKFAENNITNRTWLSYLENFYVWGNNDYSDYLKKIEAVTNESIKTTAKKLLTQGNIATLVQLPE